MNGSLDIAINFECTKKTIDFKISNTHDKSGAIQKGIGLENIKKRLELLFKNQYDLVISESDELYEVRLKLQMKHD